MPNRKRDQSAAFDRYFTDQKKGEVNELRMVRENLTKPFLARSTFPQFLGFLPLFSVIPTIIASSSRQLLKTVNVDRDPRRKREVIKKVIAYMTLGIDVSRLFNEMVLCVETRDLVVKKMVYLYLVSCHASIHVFLFCFFLLPTPSFHAHTNIFPP